MTDPQTFQEFLEERLRVFDPTVDLTTGSPAQVQIIQPALDFIGSDPFSMPALDFIMARVAQEYPSLDAGEYSALRDIMAKPHVPVVNALRLQIDNVRKNQSLNNPAALADVEADALAANWFTGRREGEFVTTPVRVYYSAPKYVTVTTSHRFYTNGGLNYYPPYAQAVTAEQMTSQRSGNLYYADFIIRAEEAGSEYAVEAGDISNVAGLPSAVRVANLSKVSGGAPRETTIELINRTRSSTSERSLVAARATYAKLMNTFTGIRNLEVVGFGDPEMHRDVITGGGYGAVKAGGTAFVFGTFCLLLSQFEDRGRYGNETVEVGDLIDLNYWPLLYGVPSSQQHEIFTITNIVFSSRGAAPSVPTVYLFQMNGEPTPTSTVLGGFPGLLPAVFANVTGPGKIEIADIPGGILQPTTDRGTIIIDDGEVHIGGKFDIWIRPQSDSAATHPVTAYDEAPILAERSLATAGLGTTPNIVSSTDPTLDFLAAGARPGHHLVIIDGADAGSYAILQVTRDELVLDTDLTTTDEGLAFRIVDEVAVDLVESKHLKVPFGADAPGDDLQTFVGLDTVKLGTNLLSYLVEEGDILRILEGPDTGDYEILSFDTALGGAGPQLDRTLSGSNANLSYQVFTGYGGMSLPLVRINPSGAVLLDAADQPTDVTVPPMLPVDGRNLEGFTGAEPLGDGTLGFVMPDLSPTFEPLEDVVCSKLHLFGLDEELAEAKAGTTGWPATTDEVIAYLNEVVGGGCYAESCIPCDGYVVCLSFDADAIRLNTSLTPQVAAYWNSIVEWFTDTFNAFFPSHPIVDIEMDEDGIVIPWATPIGEDSESLMQVELCLPAEFFNCCNDVFVALPELNIETLAELLAAFSTTNWQTKLAELGALLDSTSPSPLCNAEPGELLTVTEGPNAGGYSIKDVHEFHFQLPIQELVEADINDTLLDGGTVSAANYLAYLNYFWGEFTICAVSIRGEFAVGPCGAFWNLFQEGLPDIPDLPEPPAFDGYCYDDYGNFQDPFDWIVAFFAWLIEFLARLGLDIPEDILDYFGLENILLALSDMVFVGYTVGKPTCCNTVRLYFTEPTTIEVDSGGECVVIYPAEAGDVPITFYAGQPTLFQVIAGAEELLYAPCHDAPPHQVYPSKDAADDDLEVDLPRHIEVSEYDVSTQMQITDTSVPAPIELGILPGRDFLELHEEVFTLPASIPSPLPAEVDSAAVAGFTTPKLAAQIISDATAFPMAPSVDEEPVLYSEWSPVGVLYNFAGGETLVVAVSGPSFSFTGQYTFPVGNMTLPQIRDALNADANFVGSPARMQASVQAAPGQDILVLRGLTDGSDQELSISDVLSTAITGVGPGYGPVPWDTANNAVRTSTGHDDETIEIVVVDSGGTHTQQFTLNGALKNQPLAVAPYTYTNLPQLIGEMQTAGFEDDGGTPVLTLGVSAVNKLVATSVEEGAAVSITASDTVSASARAHGDYRVPDWTVATDTGSPEATLTVTVVDSGGTHVQTASLAAETTFADVVAVALALAVPSFLQDGGTPVLEVSVPALSNTVRLSTVDRGASVTIEVDTTSPIIADLSLLSFPTPTGQGVDAVPSKFRVPAGRTWRNKAYLEVLDSSGIDFVDANVQEGDLVFIEEGVDAGGYIIGDVEQYRLTLDAPLLDQSSTPVKHGGQGSWDGTAADPSNKRLTTSSGTFDTSDIGRYLTVYGAHYPGANGSFRIEDVDTTSGAWVELDAAFPSAVSETDALWVITASPATPPAAADAGGTELWGLRPFRIYKGDPSLWVVTDVDTSLDPTAATFAVQDPDDLTHLPVDGQDQPFRISRPGVQRVSSTVMAQQRDGSLYYADFLVYGLGSERIYNVPGDTRFEAVFGTYKSDGYRYEVEDNRFTFSVFERVSLYMTPSILPPGSDDNHASRYPIDGQRMEFRYAWTPLVAQLQRFVTSVQQRTVNADPLVRHFLPAYTALDLAYAAGAQPSALYKDVADYINGLSPESVMPVSAIEGLLKNAGATDWTHPIALITVTHDLDRRMVGDRSVDRLGGAAAVPYYGSNRTSYFIAGSDASGLDEDEIEQPGEKLILTRETALS